MEKLSQELNQWQLDCWASRDKATKAEQTLNVVQHELDTMRTLADDHANLKWQYDTLDNKVRFFTNSVDLYIVYTYEPVPGI